MLGLGRKIALFLAMAIRYHLLPFQIISHMTFTHMETYTELYKQTESDPSDDNDYNGFV